MEDFFNVRDVEEAREILASAWSRAAGASSSAVLAHEQVDLLSALGRVLAHDVVSTEDIPPHARSTVDGYAVIARDTHGSSEALPAMLSLGADVTMGALPSGALAPGHACRIPTGGMLPEGADACVMVEHTELLDENTVLVYRPVAAGENMVCRAEDVRAGEAVLKAGRLLSPYDLGALAALGVTRVSVVARAKVAVISTGDEVVPPDAVPLPGQIRDINSYSMAASLLAFGAEPLLMGIAKDTYGSLRGVVEEALGRADAVILSGGSSVGSRDVAVKVLDDLGPPGVLVHGVALKPGKPVILAVCGGKPVFGLPGHPVSALVALDLFARHLLCVMIAFSAKEPTAASRLLSARESRVPAVLGRNVPSAAGREDHVRVRLVDRRGVLYAEPVLGKSGLLSTMVRSDGEIVVPKDSEGLVEGSAVTVRLRRF